MSRNLRACWWGLWAVLLLWAGPSWALDGAKGGTAIGAVVASAQSQYALHVKLPEFTLNGVKLKQDRSQPKLEAFQDPGSRRCPPFCVEPESMPGAITVRLEDFPKLAGEINAGKILIVDMRTPDWYQRGTLPGAINLPYTDLSGPHTKAMARMKKLDGKDIIAFCNGWWCGQSPTGIKALLDFGYTGKIYYFRDGNQGWADAGLPFSMPK
ncbi:MAG: rhodanese-like domain-containing protein [Magnetococcales bacterium]|nr:rhodanese-like domain-containing protein [Magnetococcales bacterium]MBF0117117.1 rhodanese-like domain-containing protein [Magnetococcales bacterium]